MSSTTSTSTSANTTGSTNTNTNLVEQIQLLRDFVGATGSSSSSNNKFSESILIDCLRRCSYNIEAAAIELLTGNLPLSTAAATTSTPYHNSSSSSTKKRRHSTSAVSNYNKDDNSYVIDIENVPSAAATTTESYSSKIHQKQQSINYNNNNKNTNSNKLPPGSVTNLLLCQRWIPDGDCTTRNGTIQYNEIVQLDCSSTGYPTIRFRTKKCDGKLPSSLSKFLIPLLLLHDNNTNSSSKDYNVDDDDDYYTNSGVKRKNVNNSKSIQSQANGDLVTPLLRIRVTSIMEMKGLTIGSEVPLSITIHIVDPVKFFDLMNTNNTTTSSVNSNSKSTTSSTSNNDDNNNKNNYKTPTAASRSIDYFEQKNNTNNTMSDKRSKILIPVSQAAFQLLQWAQHGSNYIPKFYGTTTTGSSNDKSSLNTDGSPNSTGSPNNNKTIDPYKVGVNDSNDDDAVDDTELNENDFESDDIDNNDDASVTSAVLFDDADTKIDKNDASSSSSDLQEMNDPHGLADGITLRPYQKQALYFMYRLREQQGNSNNDNDTRQKLADQMQLLKELASSNDNNSKVLSTQTHFYQNHSINIHKKVPVHIICDCGPVLVSEEGQRTIVRTVVTNEINPLSHPLWEQRYLCTSDKKIPYVYYINDIFQIATLIPPIPPQQCSGGILADAMGLGKTVMLLSLILQSKNDRIEQQPKSIVKKEQDEIVIDSTNTNDNEIQVTMEPTTTLVVLKLSLLEQWKDEIRTKTNLTYSVYYGTTTNLSQADISNVDVVITTYGTIQGELRRKDPKLLHHKWLRIILDEAHCIRNHRTLASRVCCSLQAQHRWCVSGTIIQNSLNDVYGIMKFLHHEPWCFSSFWNAAVTNPTTPQQQQSTSTSSTITPLKVEHDKNTDKKTIQLALNRVRRVLRPIMLRRTKESVTADGKPIVWLPPIETKIVTITLSESEREFYNALRSRSLKIFDGFVRNSSSCSSTTGSGSKSMIPNAYIQILTLLQRLRQACDHIALTVQSRWDESSNNKNSMEDKRRSSSSATSKKLDESSKKMKQEADQEDIVDTDPAVEDDINNMIGKEFLNELLSKFMARSDTPKKRKRENVEEDDDNLISDEGDMRTTSCRKSLSHEFATNVAQLLQTAVQSGSLTDECSICLEIPTIEDAVVTQCAHTFCKDCLISVIRDKVVDDKTRSTLHSQLTIPDGECPICNQNVKANGLIVFKKDSNNRWTTKYLTDQTTKNCKSEASSSTIFTNTAPVPKQQTKIKSEERIRESQEGNAVASARNILQNIIHDGAESSKISAILDELHNVWCLDPASKVLIFSHYLGFLDLLGTELTKSNIRHYRFDGSLNRNERMNVLSHFQSTTTAESATDIEDVDMDSKQTKAKCKKGTVLLMSMSAGAEGLNITEASACFIVEPWWNSAKEDQCINRIHRIGQTAAIVRVRKFIVVDTVEERIVELQKRKSFVAGNVYNNKKNKNGGTDIDHENDDDDADNPFENTKLTIADFSMILGRSK